MVTHLQHKALPEMSGGRGTLWGAEASPQVVRPVLIWVPSPLKEEVNSTNSLAMSPLNFSSPDGKDPELSLAHNNYPTVCFFLNFFILGLHLQHIEVPQARDQIAAAGASLCHSHSNTKSEPHLWSTPQLAAMLDPLHTE